MGPIRQGQRLVQVYHANRDSVLLLLVIIACHAVTELFLFRIGLEIVQNRLGFWGNFFVACSWEVRQIGLANRIGTVTRFIR